MKIYARDNPHKNGAVFGWFLAKKKPSEIEQVALIKGKILKFDFSSNSYSGSTHWELVAFNSQSQTSLFILPYFKTKFTTIIYYYYFL